ncbi:NAD-dependent deacetylase, partial [Bacillus sp. AFS075960]
IPAAVGLGIAGRAQDILEQIDNVLHSTV